MTKNARAAGSRGDEREFLIVKNVLKILLVLLLVLLLAIVGGIVYFMHRLNAGSVPIIEMPEEQETVTPAPVVTPEPEVQMMAIDSNRPEITPVITPDPEVALEAELLSADVEQDNWLYADTGIRKVDPIDPDVINILLVGADIRDLKNAMYRNVSSHADTIMMVSINKRTDTVTLVSFMRDSYIQIRGLKGNVNMNKLNSAFSNGGMGWLINTLNYKHNYNLDIQEYMGVGFFNFSELIDSIGGIDIKLTAEECFYINWRCAELGKTDPHEDRFVILKNAGLPILPEEDGVYHLTGLQTLWYARNRTTGDETSKTGSDFTRTSRQKDVLMLVYEKVRHGLTLTELAGLTSFIMDNSYTNMRFRRIVELGIYLLRHDVKVQYITMPRAKSWSYSQEIVGNGTKPMEVVTFNIDSNRKYLHQVLYEGLVPDEADVEQNAG